MKIKDILKREYIEKIYVHDEETEVKNGYIGDLLSEIMRNAPEESIWLTHQTHPNIIAVASIVGAKVIIIPEGFNFAEETIEKAKENQITLLKSKKNIFETTGEIYNLINR
ncbi:iron-sulfur binding hydrogenase [Marinitoga sp. 1135]|uniref:DRTGG domain-containing protein n=1 Tax=Marinitoga piezophila (strain DSM 14283 / JCM 11233 / KA3) TaxID=443254 RepID=H2J6Q4_MARPK|nr:MULTISPECIES: hypothetical protein [Marinitoga]AEX86335.1 DRTGG domain-containing protein [Marinitoga piezophila KA3]APT76733.1 iron-sulfur binding hydrogenase [Marinitoga sp. 1137]NUU96510.1 iron-sulfur binding hydrogenase [Marinitoga sp. 1135]NUU98429.1 iron-sulfur binding hydrogenase [Marinitoga sp. 1138]